MLNCNFSIVLFISDNVNWHIEVLVFIWVLSIMYDLDVLMCLYVIVFYFLDGNLEPHSHKNEADKRFFVCHLNSVKSSFVASVHFSMSNVTSKASGRLFNNVNFKQNI